MKNELHHLEQKQKKKNFFVYVDNQKLNKNYSDYTLKKVAKKVTKDLLGSKKEIIFHLEEKGKSGKKYGPYMGSQKGEKIEVKTYKMKGGVITEVYSQTSPAQQWKPKPPAAATVNTAAAAQGVPLIANQQINPSFNNLSRARTPDQVANAVVSIAQTAVNNIAKPNSNKYKKALEDIRNGINQLLANTPQ
jgi:hypothetical protein